MAANRVVTRVADQDDVTANGGRVPVALLPDTAVTPGSYTNADVTVDAHGRITAAANGAGVGGGSGTVTSVGLSIPPWLAVAGSPVTTSGTIAVTAASGQTGNQVLASPDGASGPVALRALFASDIPTLPGSKITSDIGSNAQNVNGVVALAHGGTGQTSAGAGFDALAPTTTFGDLIYRGFVANLRVPGNTAATKKFLTQTGTGSASDTPAWDTVAATDVPSLNAAKVTSGTFDLTRLPDGGRTRAFTFGASGAVTTGQKPQTLRVEAACTAYQLDVTASAGTLTARVEYSSNGGSSWSTLDSLALSSGLSATKSVSQALSAGDLVRVNYTAASGASDPVVTLYARKT